MDGAANAGRGVARHARRYAPFYVFLALALVAVALTPTVEPASEESTGAGVTRDGAGAHGGEGSGPSGAAGPSLSGDSRGHAGRPGGQAQPSGTAESVPGDPTAAASGRTRAGFDCAPGIRQMPWSSYAAPCTAAFRGGNGNETWNGVTGDTIRVVFRSFAQNSDTRALDSVLGQAGVSREENRRVQREMATYLNEVFELYGRKVEIIEFTSSANPFDEVNGRGREQACADATRIAEEIRAFAVMPSDGIAFGPFTECAAEKGLFQPISAYGFPEEFYARLHPYAWGIQMSCSRIGRLYAEYIDKRLNGRPAAHAKDQTYQVQERRFGMIRPDIEFYFPCISQTDRELKRRGINVVSTYDYVLDPATLPAQMTQAAVQFKSRGVTSLLLAADFLTLINLTRAASDQDWGPEWILQGSGQQDNEVFARLYAQDVVDGHMFGMSQTGDPAAIYGPKSEAARTYREATGKELPPAINGTYFQLIQMFNQFQMAGPTLTPQTAGEGTLRMPPSSDGRAAGTWNFRVLPDGRAGFQHTAAIDAREVYWDRTVQGADGRNGTFVATLGGQRFGVGQWPGGDPKPYPNR